MLIKSKILTLASVSNALKLANKMYERDRVARDCCTMCLTNLRRKAENRKNSLKMCPHEIS